MAPLLTSPKLHELIESTRKQLAASYKIVEDILKELDLEYVPATAGLWVNAKAKDAEAGDTVAKARAAGVVIGAGTEFNTVPGEKGWLKITFALPEDILLEGMKRLGGSPSVS
jgi:aspartate/methionine/tyrosine aminotransferase